MDWLCSTTEVLIFRLTYAFQHHWHLDTILEVILYKWWQYCYHTAVIQDKIPLKFYFTFGNIKLHITTPVEYSASSKASFWSLAKNSHTKMLHRKVYYLEGFHPVCGVYKWKWRGWHQKSPVMAKTYCKLKNEYHLFVWWQLLNL